MHLIFWKASDSPNGIQKHDLHIRNRRFNLLHPNLERKNIKNEFGFYCLFRQEARHNMKLSYTTLNTFFFFFVFTTFYIYQTRYDRIQVLYNEDKLTFKDLKKQHIIFIYIPVNRNCITHSDIIVQVLHSCKILRLNIYKSN